MTLGTINTHLPFEFNLLLDLEQYSLKNNLVTLGLMSLLSSNDYCYFIEKHRILVMISNHQIQFR